jgi:hypothetical protein
VTNMTSDFRRRIYITLSILALVIASLMVLGCRSRSMDQSNTKDIAMGTFSGSLRPRDLVTYYGIILDARSTTSNPLLCVYLAYQERTSGENEWINLQKTLESQQLVIASLHHRWAVALPQREWFLNVPLHESYVPILRQLKQNPLATVPAVAAQSILRAIRTPRILSLEATQQAEKQKIYADAVAEFLAEVRWQQGSTNVTFWSEEQKNTNALLGRLKLDLDSRERQLETKAQCSAQQISDQMRPREFVGGNSFERVNVLNSAIFDAAYLPDPMDPLGRSGANQQMPQCPKSYREFLTLYDPRLMALFDRTLSTCGPVPQTPPTPSRTFAAAALQYPEAMPSRLAELGSPTERTVLAVISTAEKLCTSDKSAVVCAGLASGTDPQIVKARLEVIRKFVTNDFASDFGVREGSRLGAIWKVVNKHLKAMESSN